MSELVGRRSFLTSLAAVMAAPAIVRASSIMPVRSPPLVLVTRTYVQAFEPYGRSPALLALPELRYHYFPETPDLGVTMREVPAVEMRHMITRIAAIDTLE